MQVFIHWIKGCHKTFVPMHLILKPLQCVHDEHFGMTNLAQPCDLSRGSSQVEHFAQEMDCMTS